MYFITSYKNILCVLSINDSALFCVEKLQDKCRKRVIRYLFWFYYFHRSASLTQTQHVYKWRTKRNQILPMTVHKKLIGNFQVTCQRLSIFAKFSMFPFEDICVQTFIFSFIAVQIHVVRVLIEEFRIMCLRMTSYKKALLTILNRPCAILYVK